MGRSLLVPDRTSDSATIAGSLDDPESFAEIFDRHYVDVHRYLARRAPSAQADDLASMTFVVAFERRRSFRPDSTSARPWLLGIATNLLHERHRVARREQGTLALLNEEQPTNDDGAGEGLNTDRLAEGLAMLAPAQRDVLLLHAWEELSYEEIAEALDIPIGTVRSRLNRARAHLRSRLDAPRAHMDPTSPRSTDD